MICYMKSLHTNWMSDKKYEKLDLNDEKNDRIVKFFWRNAMNLKKNDKKINWNG